jgi:hypothetical protein
MIDISTEDGDITIDDLADVTAADLRKLGMSRPELNRCWAKGIELMKEVKPGDRCRPVATQTPKGKWVVHIVWYSPFSDPLMRGSIAGRA